jgi:hypothetical protein
VKSGVHGGKGDSSKSGYQKGWNGEDEKRGYADADGLETVEAWDCVNGWRLIAPPSCPECKGNQTITGFTLGPDEREYVWGNVVEFDGYEHKCEKCGERYDVELTERVDCPMGMFPETGISSGGINASGLRGRCYGEYQGRIGTQNQGGLGDSGSAARFFQHCDYSEEEKRLFYCAKASKKERTCNGTVECRHPTVKPLALMRYLCRLTKTPTGGVVLDPFMGSGTTGMAAILEGREFIGIEQDVESFETAKKRIATAAKKKQKELLSV